MKRLSKKEKGFVKAIVQGKTGTEAALANYDVKDEDSAASLASQNLGKLKIQEAIEEALPDELLNEVHKEGLRATRQQGVGGMVLNIEKKEFGHTEIEVPDYNVRAKYLDMAYKRRGMYAPDKHVNVNVRTEPSPRIKELAELLKKNGLHPTGNNSSN